MPAFTRTLRLPHRQHWRRYVSGNLAKCIAPTNLPIIDPHRSCKSAKMCGLSVNRHCLVTSSRPIVYRHANPAQSHDLAQRWNSGSDHRRRIRRRSGNYYPMWFRFKPAITLSSPLVASQLCTDGEQWICLFEWLHAVHVAIRISLILQPSRIGLLCLLGLLQVTCNNIERQLKVCSRTVRGKQNTVSLFRLD